MNINLAKKVVAISLIWAFTISNMLSWVDYADASGDKIVYPLKEISKLECRFQDFWNLSSNCKQTLPVLNTKDYRKYAKLNDGYNDFTRLYTVLWWSSYKYGWDVWHGWHIGTDIATAKGTPIYSIADWKIIHSKTDPALWKMISIEHYINGKKVISSYAHMSKIIAKKWDTIRAGDKIWEVGSTGNSTWNHLHIQIDLAAPFYPYYYDYNACPYSYYTISETGKCFWELEKHSIDPLLFLETNGAVLDEYKVTSTTTTNPSTDNSVSRDDFSIFTKTVYIWYSVNDIKKVQEIFKDLGYYNWSISGNYEDVLDEVIAYQVDRGVIENKNSYGAGWFGPGTRAQAKVDYNKYLAWGWNSSGTTDEDTVVVITEKPTVDKIDKDTLMTREEIEAREVEEFLKDFNIQLNLKDAGWNIKVWKSVELNLTITDKKDRPFRWNMPGGMTFVADNSTVQIFPEKLFYFTDGKRDIFIKWLKPGNITISVKIWGVTIKRIPVKVYEDGKIILPKDAVIIADTSPVVGEVNNGIVIFNDQSWAKLLNLQYDWNYKLSTGEWVKVCLKEWNIDNLSKIIKLPCEDKDFKTDITFTYQDTVGWIVVFDYKALQSSNTVKVINTKTNQVLATTNLKTKSPLDVDKSDVYMNEIMHLLSKWVIWGINKWYFLDDREITKLDSLTWIQNALYEYQDQATTANTAYKIAKNISEIETAKSKVWRFDTITRKDLLEYTYKYLVFEDSTNIHVKNYKDLDDDQNLLASYVLNNKTWKDKFGENYFQPKKNVTRWETAFILNNILNQNKHVYLTLK